MHALTMHNQRRKLGKNMDAEENCLAVPPPKKRYCQVGKFLHLKANVQRGSCANGD